MDRRSVERLLAGYGISDFQRDVLVATASIPRGETATYAGIARMIGRPKAARAVGTALKNNPLPITIPCHRVIRSDGSVGWYAGRASGRTEKLRLLASEGATKKKKKAP